MRMLRRFGLVLGLGASLTLGAVVDEAAAQANCGGGGGIAQVNCALNNQISDASGGEGGEGGDASGGDGGNGGRGGFASIHDVDNAHADASSSVILDNITTGDAIAHQVNVDARGATAPVVVVVAGSFPDTGVDVFAPGGNALAGTTGGYGLTADASGGEGGEGGDARSGAGGDGGSGGLSLPILDATISQVNVAEDNIVLP